MPYLDAVIKEGLRLYGPVYYNGRCFDKDLNFNENLKIKVDPETKLHALFMLHSSMKHEITRKGSKNGKNDHQNFRPERFINNEYNLKAYSPFSRGVRDCIGYPLALLSMKIQLIHIYKNFKTEVVYRDSDDDFVVRPMEANFIFQIRNEPCIRFLRR